MCVVRGPYVDGLASQVDTYEHLPTLGSIVGSLASRGVPLDRKNSSLLWKLTATKKGLLSYS